MTAGWMAAALIAVQAAGGGGEPTMRLRCDGRGDLLVARPSVRGLANGGVSTSTSYGRRRDDARVLFEMSDGAARLHLPSSLVTAVHGGDTDGWWPVSDLRVSDEAISGRIRINIVNKPAFRIDRVDGDIELNGLMPFHGQCESTAEEKRKF